MADNSFNNTVESLFKGMDSFITTKTVVGDAIHIGDTIILPLVDVSFGVAAGAFSQEKKNNGAGGMGGKINPSAVLVIQNDVGNRHSPTVIWFRILSINLHPEKIRMISLTMLFRMIRTMNRKNRII